MSATSTAPKNHVLSNVTATILARVGYMATRVMIPPFVLAHMSLQEYGVWTSAFILVSYLGVSTMGISNVYIRYTAKYEAEGDFRSANELLSTGLFVTIPMCACLFGLLVVFWNALASAVRLPPQMAGDAKEAVYLVVLVFLSSISLCAFGDALSGVQRIDIGQKIWVAGYVLETVLIFVFVGLGRGVRGMAEAFFARTVLGVVLSVILAYRIIPWLKVSPRLVSRRAMRDLVSFGSAVQLQCLLDVVLNSAERVVALMVAGFSAAGLLDIAKKMPSSVSAIPLAFASAFLPAASRLEASSAEGARDHAVREFYLSGAKLMNITSAYFCAFLALLAFPILHVWLGKELPYAGVLLTVFAVSMQVHLLTGPGTSITKGIGRPGEEFHYCIPNLIALALFVPASKVIFGAYSALSIGLSVAAATLVSALYFLWRMDRQLRISHLDYFKMVILPGAVPYLLASPLALVLRQNNLLQAGRLQGAAILGACGVVYTALFAAFTYLQVLTEDQRIYVKNTVLRFSGSQRIPVASTAAQFPTSGSSSQ